MQAQVHKRLNRHGGCMVGVWILSRCMYTVLQMANQVHVLFWLRVGNLCLTSGTQFAFALKIAVRVGFSRLHICIYVCALRGQVRRCKWNSVRACVCACARVCAALIVCV